MCFTSPKNSLKSILPLPSASTSFTFCTHNNKYSVIYIHTHKYTFVCILFIIKRIPLLTISWSSASLGFIPNLRRTVPSSTAVMFPSPSVSNNWKASLYSAISSGVSWSDYKSIVSTIVCIFIIIMTYHFYLFYLFKQKKKKVVFYDSHIIKKKLFVKKYFKLL
jgi:hypothetical protein